MDEIKNGKILVANSINAINYAKQYGEMNLKNIYLLNIVNELLTNLGSITFEEKQCLDTLYNYIRYNNVRGRYKII
jgi:hypothetical protein